MNIHKARFLHPLLVRLGRVDRALQLVTRCQCCLVPFPQSVFRFVAVIIAFKWQVDVLKLEPAAWLEVIICLLEETWPVLQRTAHHARMNVVELAVIDPLLLGVVDEESEVGRD